MNRKLYSAAAALPEEQLRQDKGAFFGSIFGTLNHIAVGDIVWLKRIAQHFPNIASLKRLDDFPTPTALDQQLCGSLSALADLRASLDEAIIEFTADVSAAQLDEPFEYASMKGEKGRRLLGDVLLHLFNHQTHHRGQVTALFSQSGIEVGPTDLIWLMPTLP